MGIPLEKKDITTLTYDNVESVSVNSTCKIIETRNYVLDSTTDYTGDIGFGPMVDVGDFGSDGFQVISSLPKLDMIDEIINIESGIHSFEKIKDTNTYVAKGICQKVEITKADGTEIIVMTAGKIYLLNNEGKTIDKYNGYGFNLTPDFLMEMEKVASGELKRAE